MLINRCELKGKHAVDCLTQGIYDPNVRMNVQGANLSDPESVLKYFRSITSKVDLPRRFPQNNQNNNEYTSRKIADMSTRKPTNMAQVICYNCGETGHIVTKCPKDVVKCKKCRRFGHDE